MKTIEEMLRRGPIKKVWVPIRKEKIEIEREGIYKIRKVNSKTFYNISNLKILLNNGNAYYCPLIENPGKTDRRRMYVILYKNTNTGEERVKIAFKSIKIELI